MYLFSDQNIEKDYTVWWCGALTFLRTTDLFSQNDQYSASDSLKLREVVFPRFFHPQKLFAMRCLPIFIDSELNQLYYNGYCKSILSPMLHGCTMVYDDAENSFSYQKNTLLTVSYQNAYRRVNNLFAQEILRYCEMLRVLDNEYPRFLEFPI